MTSITRYDPVGDLFDDLFKGFFVRPVGYETDAPARRMKLDLTERNGEFRVLAELPGVKKENIQISIDGDTVSISAESQAARDVKEGERVLHGERRYGKMSRAFRLGQEVDESRASAKYSDGVLELTLPKKTAAAAKRISIQ